MEYFPLNLSNANGLDTVNAMISSVCVCIKYNNYNYIYYNSAVSLSLSPLPLSPQPTLLHFQQNTGHKRLCPFLCVYPYYLSLKTKPSWACGSSYTMF